MTNPFLCSIVTCRNKETVILSINRLLIPKSSLLTLINLCILAIKSACIASNLIGIETTPTSKWLKRLASLDLLESLHVV